MSDEQRTREPGQIVAALEIARAGRKALADGFENYHETGFDSEVLFYELFRTTGMLVRVFETPPSKLEELIEFMRRVYAGLSSGAAPSVEEVLQRLCPESNMQGMSGDTQTERKVLQ